MATNEFNLESEWVDVSIPFRGRLDYLEKTLQSLLAQTNQNWKAVILNNMPEDAGATRLVQKIGDGRIRVIDNPINVGLARNFELARRNLNSRWGLILGADDILKPNYIECMISYAKQYPNVAFIHPRVGIIDETEHTYYTINDFIKWLLTSKKNCPVEIPSAKAKRKLLIGNWIYFPSVLFNNELLKSTEFRIDLPIVSDLDIELKLLKLSQSMLQVPETLFNYRRHSGSMSSSSTNFLNRFEEESAYLEEVAFHEWHDGAKLNFFILICRPFVRIRLVLFSLKANSLNVKYHAIKLALTRGGYTDINRRKEFFNRNLETAAERNVQ